MNQAKLSDTVITDKLQKALLIKLLVFTSIFTGLIEFARKEALDLLQQQAASTAQQFFLPSILGIARCIKELNLSVNLVSHNSVEQGFIKLNDKPIKSHTVVLVKPDESEKIIVWSLHSEILLIVVCPTVEAQFTPIKVKLSRSIKFLITSFVKSSIDSLKLFLQQQEEPLLLETPLLLSEQFKELLLFENLELLFSCKLKKSNEDIWSFVISFSPLTLNVLVQLIYSIQ